MIIITQPNATEDQIERVVARVREFGLDAADQPGASRVIIGVIGAEDRIREKPLAAMPGVEAIVPVEKPYKLASFEFRGAASPVAIGGVKIGGDENVALICGPCSVESREQISSIARIVKDSGADILRGGAFKPRTSPYSFQGLREEGLRFLAEARRETGLPVITEIMDARDLAMVEKYADCLQIGTRNMQNFSLLKEVGRSHLPVLLKRGFSARISDLIMSAEYILSEGNMNVLLCERGIRTFENATRYTLDLNAVPLLKSKTHLPVVVDPTHGIGLRDFVPQMALAAIAAGADAVMIEVHDSPQFAKSDGDQAHPARGFRRSCSTPARGRGSRRAPDVTAISARHQRARAPVYMASSSMSTDTLHCMAESKRASFRCTDCSSFLIHCDLSRALAASAPGIDLRVRLKFAPIRRNIDGGRIVSRSRFPPSSRAPELDLAKIARDHAKSSPSLFFPRRRTGPRLPRRGAEANEFRTRSGCCAQMFAPRNCSTKVC